LALETLRARGWWRAVAIETAVITAASLGVFAILSWMGAFEASPLARLCVSIVAGVLVGMTLRRPWRTTRFVVCGIFILTVGVILAVLFEGGEVAGADLPIDAVDAGGNDEEDKGKRRVNDAIGRRRRRLAELGG
jgi:hypothetical protein